MTSKTKSNSLEGVHTEKTYDWWCNHCDGGCDEECHLSLEEDSEGCVLCPNCDKRLVDFNDLGEEE